MADLGGVKTRLCSWGTSRAVRIPKDLCEAVGIDIESQLSMKAGSDELGSYIVIRPGESEHRHFSDAQYRSMDEIFAGYDGDFKPTEFDWGTDVGAEVVE